jgi:hypothetical protein
MAIIAIPKGVAKWPDRIYACYIFDAGRLALPSKLRPRLTYANVMATIAVFVALGGSSYAAIKVTGKNVKDSSLTGKDIKNSSLTTSDVKNGSLLSLDFKPGQLPPGAPGPKGDTGLQGPKGDAGAPNPNAVNSDQLDNLDSTDFLRSNGKAADSDKLDGLDSTAFARGPGQILTRDQALSPNSQHDVALPGLGTFRASCPSGSPPTSMTLSYINSAGTMFLWDGPMGATRTLTRVLPGVTVTRTVTGTQQSTWQISGTTAPPIATFTVYAMPGYNGVSACYWGLQGLYSDSEG